jgi:23S rRNA pseudouridine2605 synthase
MTQENEKIRLQAYLASCGIGSRRFCEGPIQEGRVRINGNVAELGDSVHPGETVTLDGKSVTPQERLRYILLNKPPGFVATLSDERDRPTAAGILGNKVAERVYNVGRLDQWSSGMLIFTNDGQFSAVLGHPRGEIDKEYLVETDLPIPQDLPERFERGIMLEGLLFKADDVRLRDDKSMTVTLVEGRNREIRKILAQFGLRALTLRRIRIGPVHLDSLVEGEFRDLDEGEVRQILEYSASRKKGRGEA